MSQLDLASIVWRAPEWINALGGLRTDNILEYFAQSPFFDKRSNNAVLKMQSQFQRVTDVNEALRRMRGLEFVVHSEAPPNLWTIAKQQREGYDEARPVELYFIANGNIYLAPDLHSIVASRVLNVTKALQTAVDELNKSVSFDISSGYQYSVEDNQNEPALSLENAEDQNIATDEVVTDLQTAVGPSPELAVPATLTETDIRSMHKALFNTIHGQTS